MSWEEELRQLDEALAAGKLSASGHRKRRDEILAEASSAQSSTMRTGVHSRSAWLPSRPTRRPVAPPSLPPELVTPAQAQEMFVNGTRSSSRRWLAPLAIVVVLGVAAAGVWWFSFAGDDGQQGAASTSTAQPAPGGIDQLKLPGTADDRNGKLTVQRALEVKVISPLEAGLLQQGGITDVTYVGASEGEYRYLVYAYPSADPAAARAKTTAVARVHEQIGLTEAPLAGLPGGVQAVELRNAKAAVIRALYTSGSATVQLAVLQEPAGDPAALEASFKRALALAVAKLPPG